MICELIDLSPSASLQSQFRDEALLGLLQKRKSVPAKFLYDRKGSELFDRICDLPEYYPTRTEKEILKNSVEEIVECLGNHTTIVEFGSGSSTKTRLLLNELADPCAYVSVDISREFLLESSRVLSLDYRGLPIIPIWADYTRGLSRLERELADHTRKVIFFPGSTIGNMEPEEAESFLGECAWFLGPSGKMLIGFDLVKSPEILDAAYNDSAGITAAFNLNLLERMNRELSADFDLAAFRHFAFFDSTLKRVEMHLQSLRDQTVRVAGREIDFGAEETIHTENSYKYTLEGFTELADRAGFTLMRSWTDERRYFGVMLLEARKVLRRPEPLQELVPEALKEAA